MNKIKKIILLVSMCLVFVNSFETTASTWATSEHKQIKNIKTNDNHNFKILRLHMKDEIKKLEKIRAEEKAKAQKELEEKQRLAELEKQKAQQEEIIELPYEEILVEVSFYTVDYRCTPDLNGITASGTYVQEGRTIALPQGIPFGTEIYIEGLGTFINEDTGSYIAWTYDEYGNQVMRVDVYLDSYEEAVQRGRYVTNARIYY